MADDQGTSQDALTGLSKAMESAEPGDLQNALAGLSPEAWASLRWLIGAGATRSVEADLTRAIPEQSKQGRVILLPGVMGTDLAVAGKDGMTALVWFSLKALAFGGLKQLRLPAAENDPRVTLGGLMRLFYLPLQLRLGVRWQAQLFPYDWRVSISDSADLLAEATKPFIGKEPVHFVAHSMGGLVCRAFMARHEGLWNQMPISPDQPDTGGRLIMLGTPNRGSFAPALTFCGRNTLLRMLAFLDVPLRKQDLIEVLATFPGLYEMLPPVAADIGDAAAKLYKVDGWPEPVVSQELLDAATSFHESIEDSVDPARMVYVAGFDRRTVDNMRRQGSKFQWHVTRNGDGTVPHVLGRLPGVPTFWTGAKHGSIPKDHAVLRAIDDLLVTGTTEQLPGGADPPAHRGPAEDEWVDDDALVSDDELAALRTRGEGQDHLLLGDLIPVADTDDVPHAPVRIEVVWGDIEKADATVIAVGHYDGVYPTAAEAAVDEALSRESDGNREDRVLYQATARGVLIGSLGEVSIFPWPRRDEMKVGTRSGAAEGVIAAAVLGLGRPGTFGLAQHEVVVRNLVWTVERVIGGGTVATVLFGVGADNLGIRETVESFVRSLDIAVRERELTGRVTTIQIVEHELGRARQMHALLKSVLQGRDSTAPAIIELPPVSEGAGGKVSDESALSELLLLSRKEPGHIADELQTRELTATMASAVAEHLSNLKPFDRGNFEVRRPASDEADEVPTRFSILVRDNEIRVAAISDAATVSERALGLDLQLFQDLVEQANIEARGNLDRAGELLMRLAVPEDFRPFLRQKQRMIVEVDKFTAGIPWEVLKLGAGFSAAPSFLGLTTPLARQLLTSLSPPPTVTGRVALRRVLVIGDPGRPGGGGALPGAREEAQAVVNLLRGQHVEVHHLVGPDGGGTPEAAATRKNVLHHLLTWQYDIVHYAGHGTFSGADGRESGWMLADGLLTGAHLTMVERLPPLLVANACHSARTSTGLPGLADEFMGRGVRNMLGTSRAVGDASAKVFSRAFYDTLLGRSAAGDSLNFRSLGRAVLNGRKQLEYGRPPDWDAYQLYGDPDFRFWPKGEGRAGG